MRRTVGALLASVLALAACGGGDDVDPEADRAAVQRAVDAFLDQLDEDGFTEDESRDEGNEIEAQSEECEPVIDAIDDDDLPDETAREEIPPFAAGEFADDGSGGQATVEAMVGFSRDSGALDEAFDALDDERLGDCLVEAFGAELTEGPSEEEPVPLELVEIEFSRGDEPGVGERSVALEVDGEIGFGDFSFPFHTTALFARDGRLAAMVVVTTVGSGPPSVDGEELLELLLEEATAD